MNGYAWDYIGCLVAPDMILKWDAYDISGKESWGLIMKDGSEILEHKECRPYLWECKDGKLIEIQRDKSEEIIAASLVEACEDLMVLLYNAQFSLDSTFKLPHWIVEHEGDRLYALSEGIPLEEYL